MECECWAPRSESSWARGQKTCPRALLPPPAPSHLSRAVCRLAPQLPWTSGHLISQEERGKIYMQTREVSCGLSSGKQVCATSKQKRTSAAACHTSPCISEHS